MAKKKTTTVTTSEVVLPDPPASETAPPDPAELDSLDEWDALDDAEGLKFQVHKLPTRAGEREAYCYTYTGADLSLDTIRETFGGGTYRITARDSKNQYAGSKRVSIIDLPKPPVTARDGEYLSRGERSGTEALTLIMKVMEEQGKLLTSLLTRPPPPPQSGPTALELIQLIKAMEPKTSDPIGTLLKGIELGKSLGGGGDDEDGILGLGKSALGALAPLIAQQAAKPKPAMPAAAPSAQLTAPPATNGAAEPAATPKQENAVPMDDIQKKIAWLRIVTADLVARASRSKDPELYAEVLLDNLPPFITEQEIFERMSEPDAIDKLAMLNPHVKQYKEWFEHFRKAVIDSFDEDEEAPPEVDSPDAGLG
jgi:hypothetical protein